MILKQEVFESCMNDYAQFAAISLFREKAHLEPGNRFALFDTLTITIKEVSDKVKEFAKGRFGDAGYADMEDNIYQALAKITPTTIKNDVTQYLLNRQINLRSKDDLPISFRTSIDRLIIEPKDL
jgi:hypothetical protein